MKPSWFDEDDEDDAWWDDDDSVFEFTYKVAEDCSYAVIEFPSQFSEKIINKWQLPDMEPGDELPDYVEDCIIGALEDYIYD